MRKTKSLLLGIWLFFLCAAAGRAQLFNGKQHHKGRTHIAHQEYDAAIAAYDALLQSSPNDAQAYLSRGYAYWQKKDTLRALADYQQAAEKGGSAALKAMAHHNMGYVREQQAGQARAGEVKQVRLQEAIAHYKNALRQTPHDEATRANLVRCQQELKQLQGAPNTPDKQSSSQQSSSSASTPPPQRQHEEILQRTQKAEQRTRKKLARQRVKTVAKGNQW